MKTCRARSALLAGSMCLLLACGREPMPPNIVFIFTDDHASHAIGAYGSVINQTPNLDRLAREGMLFRNAFVTNSICAPSRATVLTGQYGHLNGVPTNRDTLDLHSIEYAFPKLLRAAGYETAMIGKWHLKLRPDGFDHYEVLRGQGLYYNPLMLTPGDSVRYTG
ncbi:MAG: sulfatase-like hydrolase/transferase, partial [Gemmatimonadetes bacterium]|nr:sulfatase-like hydrolase/transferase [Gemmatimonadota bacterium]